MNFKPSIFLLRLAVFTSNFIFSSAMPPAQQPALPAAQRPPKHPGKSQAKVLKDSTVSYINLIESKTVKEREDIKKDVKTEQIVSATKPKRLITKFKSTDTIELDASPRSVLIRATERLDKEMLKEALHNEELARIFIEAHYAYEQLKTESPKTENPNIDEDLWQKFNKHNEKLCDLICDHYATSIEGLKIESELLTCEPIESVCTKRFDFNKKENTEDNTLKHPWHKIIEYTENLAQLLNGASFELYTKPIVTPFIEADNINKAFTNEIYSIFNNFILVIERIEKNIQTQPSQKMLKVFTDVTRTFDELNKMLNNVDPIYNKKRAEYRQLIQKIHKEATAKETAALAATK